MKDYNDILKEYGREYDELPLGHRDKITRKKEQITNRHNSIKLEKIKFTKKLKSENEAEKKAAEEHISKVTDKNNAIISDLNEEINELVIDGCEELDENKVPLKNPPKPVPPKKEDTPPPPPPPVQKERKYYGVLSILNKRHQEAPPAPKKEDTPPPDPPKE